MSKKQSATRRILKIVGLLGVVLLLVVVIGAWMGLFGGGGDGTPVQMTEVQRRDITQTVTAFGRVQPEQEVVISPDVPGEVIALPVQEGERVRRGELLARVEAKDYVAQAQQQRAGVSQARATLAQRQADLKQARQDYERKKKLFDREVISRQAYEAAQAQFEQAQAQLQAARSGIAQAQARLEESQEQVRQTSIYAPISGTISKLSIEEGERVVGTDRQPGTEMMRVARLDQMEVEVDVNESDVVNVSLHDTAAVEVDAYPDRTFEGVVTEIANSARVSGEGTQEQVTNFPVKVRLLTPHNLDARPSRAAPASSDTAQSGGPALRQPEAATFGPEGAPTFRPGMSATVDISTQTVPDAVAVPIQAVTKRDFNRVHPQSDSSSADSSGGDAPSRKGRKGENAQKNGGGGGGGRVREEDLRTVVFLAKDGEARMAEVETGISDDTHIEIRSGLDVGQTVITGPYRAVSRTLRPGMAVKKDNHQRGGGEGAPATASAQE